MVSLTLHSAPLAPPPLTCLVLLSTSDMKGPLQAPRLDTASQPLTA